MKSLGSRLAMVVTVIAIGFFGLKGCVVTVWSAPKAPTTYALVGGDGRMLSITFLPDHEALFVYAPDKKGSIEANLSTARGTYGTHFFGRLWGIERPGAVLGGIFGYRIYPEGFEPVIMEVKVKNKFVHGTNEAVFPAKDETTYPVILFAKDEIEFEGMRLEPVSKLSRQDNDASELDKA